VCPNIGLPRRAARRGPRRFLAPGRGGLGGGGHRRPRPRLAGQNSCAVTGRMTRIVPRFVLLVIPDAALEVRGRNGLNCAGSRKRRQISGMGRTSDADASARCWLAALVPVSNLACLRRLFGAIGGDSWRGCHVIASVGDLSDRALASGAMPSRPAAAEGSAKLDAWRIATGLLSVIVVRLLAGRPGRLGRLRGTGPRPYGSATTLCSVRDRSDSVRLPRYAAIGAAVVRPGAVGS